MKKIALLAAGVAAASTLMIAPAQANQLWNVSGTLNTSGTLVQYSTWRPHSTGVSDFTISNQVGCSGNRWSRWGLRKDYSSSQYTNSIQINGETGNGRFKRASDGSTSLPTGQYAINGRMANETGHGCDNAWAGSIWL
ncbi:MAG: hypothetical protein KC457_32660 [Myxococcales bacterium]|nr:hypothetical protein [Myxococcales bacterium]